MFVALYYRDIIAIERCCNAFDEVVRGQHTSNHYGSRIKKNAKRPFVLVLLQDFRKGEAAKLRPNWHSKIVF